MYSIYCYRFSVNYQSTGTGRDTFVKHNNGGFFKAYHPVKAAPVGSFLTKRRPPAAPRPAIVSRGIYYHSDGSGRDNYIEIDSGGLNYTSNKLEYREAFKASLRSIDRP